MKPAETTDIFCRKFLIKGSVSLIDIELFRFSTDIVLFRFSIFLLALVSCVFPGIVQFHLNIQLVV